MNLKLAFIHPFIYRYPRGIERYTLNLSAALAQLGAQVDILTWRWPQPIVWPDSKGQVRIRSFPTARYYAAWCMVPYYVAHLLQHRYDMLFIHFADYGEALALNFLHTLGLKQPYSIVFHYPYSQVPHRYQAFAQSRLAERAQRVIAVSQFVADEAHSFLERECAVISHGVDSKQFKPNPVTRTIVRSELGIPNNAPILLTVSALEERKGVQWMIRALPLIAHQIPDVVYVVVGNGPHQEALKRLVKEIGIELRVHFVAGQADVARFYQAADLFVILSKGEASSIVSLEAMACQIPVIASKHPPFHELISANWGMQVDERNEEILAQAAIDLLLEPAKRQQMGEAGRKHILSHHTWERVAEQYLKLLAGPS